MTGDLLLRISGQGAVYIRTNNLDEQSSDEEDESMFLRSPFETPTFNDDIPPIILEQVVRASKSKILLAVTTQVGLLSI